MPEMTGTVRCVRISDSIAVTRIEDTATGETELLYLWYFPGESWGTPRNLTAFTRILHSMWISQLREALSNNLSVTIVYRGGGSALVTAVQLG